AAAAVVGTTGSGEHEEYRDEPGGCDPHESTSDLTRACSSQQVTEEWPAGVHFGASRRPGLRRFRHAGATWRCHEVTMKRIWGARPARPASARPGAAARPPEPAQKRAFYATPFTKRPTVPALIALGRELFFDPALSASGKLACATCHDPAHAYGPPNDRAV